MVIALLFVHFSNIFEGFFCRKLFNLPVFLGFLGKSVEDLSKAVTDLLVRQKQVTVGMPPHHEVIVSGGAALKSRDLMHLIHNAYCGDESMTVLTQELLVYLSMFIQTEPELYHGMLRLRIGLIIQVMVSEMARCLKFKDDDDAADELMTLSPYEMRNLLHHIMSGREFRIKPAQKVPNQHCQSCYNIISENDRVSKVKIFILSLIEVIIMFIYFQLEENRCQCKFDFAPSSSIFAF